MFVLWVSDMHCWVLLLLCSLAVNAVHISHPFEQLEHMMENLQATKMNPLEPSKAFSRFATHPAFTKRNDMNDFASVLHNKLIKPSSDWSTGTDYLLQRFLNGHYPLEYFENKTALAPSRRNGFNEKTESVALNYMVLVSVLFRKMFAVLASRLMPVGVAIVVDNNLVVGVYWEVYPPLPEL